MRISELLKAFDTSSIFKDLQDWYSLNQQFIFVLGISLSEEIKGYGHLFNWFHPPPLFCNGKQ